MLQSIDLYRMEYKMADYCAIKSLPVLWSKNTKRAFNKFGFYFS